MTWYNIALLKKKNKDESPLNKINTMKKKTKQNKKDQKSYMKGRIHGYLSVWRSARLIPFSFQRWLQCLLRWDCKDLGTCNPTQKGCRSPPGKCSPCKRNTAFKSFDSFPVFGISLLISKCDLTSPIQRIQHPHVTDRLTDGDREVNRLLGLATNLKK